MEASEVGVSAIIVAAGQGKRMGASRNKLLLPLAGVPILWHTLSLFDTVEEVQEIILVVAEQDEPFIREMVREKGVQKPLFYARGGEQRADSVQAGLAKVSFSYVLVHDGARPLTLPEDIRKVAQKAKASGAAVLGVPVKETVKRTDGHLSILETPRREGLWLAQTPQAFLTSLLKEAYRVVNSSGVTDDASVVEQYGHRVMLVPGSEENLKVTLSQDLIVAEWILEKRRRTSCDSHRAGI